MRHWSAVGWRFGWRAIAQRIPDDQMRSSHENHDAMKQTNRRLSSSHIHTNIARVRAVGATGAAPTAALQSQLLHRIEMDHYLNSTRLSQREHK
jgi:hypothetical protein